MRFAGTLDDLIALFDNTNKPEINKEGDNKVVFRFSNRAIMNWFISTGTLQFQGPPRERGRLEEDVTAKLNGNGNTIQEGKEERQTQDFNKKIPTLVPELESELETTTNSRNILLQNNEYNFLFDKFSTGELFLGIVSPVGTPLTKITEDIINCLKAFKYKFIEIRVSKSLETKVSSSEGTESEEFKRIFGLMRCGDSIRKKTRNNAILAMAAINEIKQHRNNPENKNKKLAFFINSLKHPDEVQFIRKVYGQGFYLIGVHADVKRRIKHLTDDKLCSTVEASKLIDVDENENAEYGQKTRDTFHLADFFLNIGNNPDLEKEYVSRFFELVFSHPYRSPTFDEYAMFMAFSCSTRSADLSRQVGAILTKDEQIIATGVNDCPHAGGGQYWAHIANNKICDDPNGRDYTRGIDANKAEQQEIIKRILDGFNKENLVGEDKHIRIKEIIADSGIGDLIEFGRVVHAEMETLLSCGRAGIHTKGTTLYCTTFPCHNCAKHIIDAGVLRVVYVEPYPKSKALDLHDDAIKIKTETNEDNTKVVFESFQGIAARRFLDLFSLNLGTGNKIKRKDKDGRTVDWDRSSAILRVPKLISAYEKLEEEVEKKHKRLLSEIEWK